MWVGTGCEVTHTELGLVRSACDARTSLACRRSACTYCSLYGMRSCLTFASLHLRPVVWHFAGPQPPVPCQPVHLWPQQRAQGFQGRSTLLCPPCHVSGVRGSSWVCAFLHLSFCSVPTAFAVFPLVSHQAVVGCLEQSGTFSACRGCGTQ